MHSDQLPYRDLCEALAEYEGASTYEDILSPWLEQHGETERQWMTAFAVRSPDDKNVDDELWRLYAASRLSQTMLLAFQTGNCDWEGPRLTLGEYIQFFKELGFEISRHNQFHPFFCEVVELEQDDDDGATPVVVNEFWPCLMLGNMLFERAGCHVRAGKKHLVKDVAERTTLYWAYRRRHRRVSDLSAGWGSNSQWRTDFRRDYVVGDLFLYNVDAEREDDETRSYDLPPPLAWEVLRHRSLVTTNHEREDDLFPYDGSGVERGALRILAQDGAGEKESP